jgi:hypothetical protein
MGIDKGNRAAFHRKAFDRLKMTSCITETAAVAEQRIYPGDMLSPRHGLDIDAG